MIISSLRLVYSLLFTLLLPFIFLRLWWRGKHLPAYRQRWAERLGFVSFKVNQKSIWVHAVSVGEVLAAVPLIKQLQIKYPNTPIIVTTMTPTGSERVIANFQQDLNKTVFHSYVPYDIPFAINRFIKKTTPKYLIIMETELWPNLLAMGHKNTIPIMIVNARLSTHSFKNYQRLKCLMKPLLSYVTLVAVQSQMDAQRYAGIGMPQDKIINTGNIKYDLKIPEDIKNKALNLRQIWDEASSPARPVWIAASTHQGEEALVLSVFLKLQKQYPSCLLLLVPRHPDRFEAVYQQCLATGLSVSRKSQIQTKKNIQIFLGDTMGDLWEYYAASDIVFMGGSLVPVGGHNFLEPAALGLPILTGPHVFNFLEISHNLIRHQGLKLVQNAQELESQIIYFLENPDVAGQMGQAAQKVAEDNRGALDRVLDLIQFYD